MPTALRDQKKQLLKSIQHGSQDSFSILTGDASKARLTLVLIGCVQSVFDELLDSLTKLLEKHKHLSLYLSPGALNINFILCGTLPDPLWVFKNLIEKNQDRQVGIHAVDLEPLRLRWVEDMQSDGPLRIQRTQDKTEAYQLIDDGGCWLDEPSTGISCYLFFGHAKKMIEQAQKSNKPLIRDLYRVKTTAQKDDSNRQLAEPFGLFADEFQEPHMVGFAKISQERPYQFLTQWRKEFHRGTDASVEMVPLEPVREGTDFVDDPNLLWRGLLDGADVQKRLGVGWISNGAPPDPEGPEFEIQRMTTVVLGLPRTGKSVIAYHLLSRYLKLEEEPFTVVVWNCKEGDQALSGDRPRHPKGLLDYAAVVHEGAGKPVIVSKPSALLAAFEQHGPGAYYTEMDPGDAPSAAVCEELGKEIGSRFVFCFDEIVNRTPHPNLLNYMGRIFKQGAENDYYVMLIHQFLGELFSNIEQFLEDDPERHKPLKTIWPGLPDAACYFLKKLDSSEQTLFDKLCRPKKPFLDEDFHPFQDMDYQKVGVLQPHRKSTEKLIPVSVPGYSVPEEERKKQFIEKVSWGKLDFEQLCKQA